MRAEYPNQLDYSGLTWWLKILHTDFCTCNLCWQRRIMRQTSANKQTKKQAGHTRNANKQTQKQRRASRGARTRAKNTCTQTHAHTRAREYAHKSRHTENRQTNKTNTQQREPSWARSHGLRYRARWPLQSRPAFLRTRQHDHPNLCPG